MKISLCAAFSQPLIAFVSDSVLHWDCGGAWHRLPREVGISLSCQNSRNTVTLLSDIRFGWSCVKTEFGLSDPCESLPTWDTLRFCNWVWAAPISQESSKTTLLFFCLVFLTLPEMISRQVRDFCHKHLNSLTTFHSELHAEGESHVLLACSCSSQGFGQGDFYSLIQT